MWVPNPGGAGTSAPPGSGCGGVAFRMADPVRVTLDADKADVWALGVSMVTCLLGVFPWGCARHADPMYDAWCDAWDRLLVAGSMCTHSSPAVPVVPEVEGHSPPHAGRRLAPATAAATTLPDTLLPLCAGLAGSGKLAKDSIAALGQLLVSGFTAPVVVPCPTTATSTTATLAAAPHPVPSPSSPSPLLLDLLVRMLDPRPHMRLSMEEVAAHPWMASDASAGAPGSSAVLGARAPAKALGAATGGGKGGSGSRTALPTLLSTRKPTSVREAW